MRKALWLHEPKTSIRVLPVILVAGHALSLEVSWVSMVEIRLLICPTPRLMEESI